MASNESWKAIFDSLNIHRHNFDESPFYINAQQIKDATLQRSRTSDKEVRILCKQDKREMRPQVFKDNGLFILPVHNGEFVIVKGEGYVDIPSIETEIITYHSKLDFTLESSKYGDSEAQHLNYAYATSLVRTFMNDSSLVLTISGRKRTPAFSFCVDKWTIDSKGTQAEVDAGYEGKEQIVIVEAKNTRTQNTIIRQLYYPFRQWKTFTNKPVKTLFFERREDCFSLWQFSFEDENNYNSIKLDRAARFKIES